MRFVGIAWAFAVLAAFSLPANPARAQNPATIVVLDGSGSMWGRIDGRPKLEIARETAARVLGNLPPSQKLGLLAYGHRSRGDCKDIELMVKPAAGTSGAILSAIKGMKFQGKTPLTEAVRQAAQALRSTEEPATVVLITDGLETCEADPCALAAELEKTGVNFTAHVIGFGLSREEGAKVACIAERTGGRYMEARNADGLADALASTVTKAAPPPAPKPVEARPPVRHRHYGAADLMRDLNLAPTGGNTGKNLPYPKDAAFPAEGTIAQCKAACDKDKECGAWRYEPKGSLYVDHARCFLFSPSTEFSGDPINPDEGWASGMKPDVRGLLRPYVPLGAKPDASVEVREAVAPGAEFTVLWKGPANQKDWVDIVPVGHQETSGELAYFYVNETIENGDPLEGAGTLKAPAEAGKYELRYILGRDIDRRVLARVPLTVGGPADVPATPPAAPPAASAPNQKQGGVSGSARVRQAAGGPVDATFVAADGALKLGVTWSATPAPGQNLPPEAWAMQEPVTGPITEKFLPGDYDVVGDAGDHVFAGRVRIAASGPNRFVIPVSRQASPAGEDRPGGHACKEAKPCAVKDRTGLSFMLPAGWTSDAPFIAETAAGVKAKQPTATFLGPNGHPVLTLNPLRWLDSSGTCTDSPAGQLCILGKTDAASLAALAVILPSLTYQR